MSESQAPNEISNSDDFDFYIQFSGRNKEHTIISNSNI